MKSEIIERLGKTEILLPALIGEGLQANDRVNVRLSVLQAAARHARAPETTKFDLEDECRAAGIGADAMQALPHVAAQLREILTRLEREFADVQDIEFTIQDGRLWILQTRAAKRTPLAALRFAIDLVNEKLIAPDEALKRLDGIDLNELARKRIVDCGEPVSKS